MTVVAASSPVEKTTSEVARRRPIDITSLRLESTIDEVVNSLSLVADTLAAPKISAEVKRVALSMGNKFFDAEYRDEELMICLCLDFIDELEALRDRILAETNAIARH